MVATAQPGHCWMMGPGRLTPASAGSCVLVVGVSGTQSQHSVMSVLGQ
jgi:hypothetical protein